MPMMNPNATGGAAPAQGNPNQAQKLPPDQAAALKKDPELLQAVAKFMGRPIPLDGLPDHALAELAGAVHKLGIDGAVALMQKVIPPQVKAQILAQAGGAPQGAPQ